jgi:hypothetical protein
VQNLHDLRLAAGEVRRGDWRHVGGSLRTKAKKFAHSEYIRGRRLLSSPLSGVFSITIGWFTDFFRRGGGLFCNQERRWVMTKYTGGETVKAGFYWNRGKWAAEVVPAEGGALPGTAEIVYTRIPWPVLLVVAPVMGGAFAMFLPFLGLGLLVKYAFNALTGRVPARHGEVAR